jgi:hypothetical protein
MRTQQHRKQLQQLRGIDTTANPNMIRNSDSHDTCESSAASHLDLDLH